MHRASTTVVIPRAKRGTQYAAAFRFHRNCSGIPDRPLSRTMTAKFEFQTAYDRHCERKRSNPHATSKHGLLRRAAPRNDGKIQLRDLAASSARVLICNPASEFRGCRECRAHHAPQPRMQNKIEHTSIVTTVTPEIVRHSLRNGFNAYIALSPVTGLVCHRRLRKLSLANLTPASGRQDHTTSPSARPRPRLRRRPRPPHPAPTFVTIAIRPSQRARDGGSSRIDLPGGESGIFLRKGLDSFRRCFRRRK